MASIERTAYPRFRRMISGRELDEVFTPTQDEVSWARARTTTVLLQNRSEGMLNSVLTAKSLRPGCAQA